MPDIVDWEAGLVSGQVMKRNDKVELRTFAPGSVVAVNIETTHRHIPLVRLELQPEKGDHCHAFTRVMTHPGGGGQMRVPVIEVAADPACPDRKVRVYMLEDRLVISTKDLYF